MKVEIETLLLLERPVEQSTVSTVLGPELQSNEIDVRGMYGDEAVQTVDRFLYDAWSAGLLRVDIIHGKGTGALRKRIHEYLRDVPFVESYALGEMYEGGSGMTKVHFRDE
jgi:DNA mismatch repair protein MutS2